MTVLSLAQDSASSTAPVSEFTVIVTDQAGARITQAELTFKGGITLTAHTSAIGYAHLSLPYGRYDVTIGCRGFKALRIVGLLVESAKPEALNVILQVGPAWHDFPGESVIVPTIVSDLPNVVIERPRITIRLLDVRNGKPLPNQTITVTFPHDEHASRLPSLEVKTGVDGTAVFYLPQASPMLVNVTSEAETDLYTCSTRLSTDVEQVLTDGLVSRCSKGVQACRCKFGKAVSAIRSVPGELVLFARPVTRGERSRWHVCE